MIGCVLDTSINRILKSFIILGANISSLIYLLCKGHNVPDGTIIPVCELLMVWNHMGKAFLLSIWTLLSPTNPRISQIKPLSFREMTVIVWLKSWERRISSYMEAGGLYSRLTWWNVQWPLLLKCKYTKHLLYRKTGSFPQNCKIYTFLSLRNRS